MRFWVTLIFACCLISCGNDEENINDFINKVKLNKGGDITPLPVIEVYKSNSYMASALKSPFDADQYVSALQVVEVAEKEPEIVEIVFEQTPRPDADRKREFLEGFSLESLSMVGTFNKNNKYWALIQDVSGTIHRVQVGDYLGDNSGKVKEINENKILLEEIVSDGQGGWITRFSSINLREG